MEKEAIKTKIKELTDTLLDMARANAWNSISDHCIYILSEELYSSVENFYELRKLRKQINKRKKPKSLDQIAFDLEDMYSDIYNLSLYIYKSQSISTIVEIQYHLKSSLDKDYYEGVKDNDPMLHCKIAIPPYLKNKSEKFDINWELGGLRYNWKLFWWKRKMTVRINKKKVFASDQHK